MAAMVLNRIVINFEVHHMMISRPELLTITDQPGTGIVHFGSPEGCMFYSFTLKDKILNGLWPYTRLSTLAPVP